MIPRHADPASAESDRIACEYTACLLLLRTLDRLQAGFPIDQLDHSLQCAARAEADGAPEELVIAALLHDVGKPFNDLNHPAIAAEILRGRVSVDTYLVLRTHGEFQYDRNHGGNVTSVYQGQTWYEDARRLAAWDHASFDPDYPTPSLDHFLPALRRFYGVPPAETPHAPT